MPLKSLILENKKRKIFILAQVPGLRKLFQSKASFQRLLKSNLIRGILVQATGRRLDLICFKKFKDIGINK